MNSRLSVLHLITHLRTGGAERMLTELLPSLKNLGGIKVSAAVLKTPGELEQCITGAGIDLFRHNKGTGPSVKILLKMRSLLKRTRPSILHMHGFSAGLWGRLACVGLGIPVKILTFHSMQGWRTPMKRRIINRLLSPLSDHYVAVCTAVKNSAVDGAWIRPDDITVIFNGTDMVRFQDSGDKSECRKKFGLPEGVPVIGTVGRCSPEKGGDIFIRALAALKRSATPFRAVVAGDGPTRPEMESLASELGLRPDVSFAGRVAREEIPSLLKSFDLGVVPSHVEGCSIALVEQMASGIPMVATDVGGNAELLVNGFAGLIVPPHDPNAIATALKNLLADPLERKRMGENAAIRAGERFSVENMAREHLSLYKSLLSGTGY